MIFEILFFVFLLKIYFYDDIFYNFNFFFRISFCTWKVFNNKWSKTSLAYIGLTNLNLWHNMLLTYVDCFLISHVIFIFMAWLVVSQILSWTQWIFHNEVLDRFYISQLGCYNKWHKVCGLNTRYLFLAYLKLGKAERYWWYIYLVGR